MHDKMQYMCLHGDSFFNRFARASLVSNCNITQTLRWWRGRWLPPFDFRRQLKRRPRQHIRSGWFLAKFGVQLGNAGITTPHDANLVFRRNTGDP